MFLPSLLNRMVLYKVLPSFAVLCWCREAKRIGQELDRSKGAVSPSTQEEEEEGFLQCLKPASDFSTRPKFSQFYKP